MKRLLVVALLTTTALACPKQRADVKNLTDKAAEKIPNAAEKATVADLARLTRPPNEELRERTPEEQRRFRVDAVIEKVESEADGDMKLFLRSADGQSRFVAEVPESECVSPRFRNDVERVHHKLKDHTAKGTALVVEGPGYWGYVRDGETAANGIQIHPVLNVEIETRKK